MVNPTHLLVDVLICYAMLSTEDLEVLTTLVAKRIL